VTAAHSHPPAAVKRAKKGKASIKELQRTRLVIAAIAAIEDDGVSRLTVAKVITRARVSRKTFYEFFPDIEACVLAAFEEVVTEGRRLAETAFHSRRDWRRAMRLALHGLLAAMDQQRGLAHLCVVDALAGGPRVLQRRSEILAEVAAAIELGGEDSRRAPSLMSMGIAGGLVEVLQTRLLTNDSEPLSALHGPLMAMIVMPYYGRQAAEQEFVPRGPVVMPDIRLGGYRTSKTLAGLRMRFTYRTALVLTAIAEAPGVSNREVARSAGIVDQGQVSKMLRRLAVHGLIENHGEGQAKGGSNSWRLTRLGVEVQHDHAQTLRRAGGDEA
jgi:AcrR family transcriptional regulator